MKDFKNLMIWKKAHRLTFEVFQITKTFPQDEFYGLSSQLRQACMSIPINIAEGCHTHNKDKSARFFKFAIGSAREVEVLLKRADNHKLLNDLQNKKLRENVIEVKGMLISLIVRQITHEPTNGYE